MDVWLKSASEAPTVSDVDLRRHPELTRCMHTILADWLVEVERNRRIGVNAGFLAMSVLDRYLEVCAAPVPKSQLQRVGCAALLLAAKFEDIWPPEVTELVQISAHAFTEQELCETEQDIVRTIGYQWFLTPTTWLLASSWLQECSDVVKVHAQYFLTSVRVFGRRWLPTSCKTTTVHVAGAAALLALAAGMGARTASGTGTSDDELADIPWPVTIPNEVLVSIQAEHISAVRLATAECRECGTMKVMRRAAAARGVVLHGLPTTEYVFKILRRLLQLSSSGKVAEHAKTGTPSDGADSDSTVLPPVVYVSRVNVASCAYFHVDPYCKERYSRLRSTPNIGARTMCKACEKAVCENPDADPALVALVRGKTIEVKKTLAFQAAQAK